MKYTFEITAAGCNTECAHCYVSGKPSRAVKTDEYAKAISRLRDLLTGLSGEIFVTIGNEIFNHPQAADIIKLTNEEMPEYCSYRDMYIPTTGIALINRPDKNKILSALKMAGCTGSMLTLHGNREHHNKITKNADAYASLEQAAKLLKAEGFALRFNLMLGKYLLSDWDEVAKLISAFPGTERVLTIPLYLPVERLREFQSNRVQLDECLTLKGRLSGLGIDEAAFFEKAQRNCEQSVYKAFGEKYDYFRENAEAPQWTFFNITQELDLYYGNAGLHTALLGNLLRDSKDELMQKIVKLPANYDWSAYYDLDKLPPPAQIKRIIQPIKTNYVYAAAEDCIYSWLDTIGVPTILI